MPIKKICDTCGKEIEDKKDLKILRKKKFCKKCYIKNRNKRRAETLEMSGEKEKIEELERKEDDERRIEKNKNQRERYAKKNEDKPKKKIREESKYIPKRYKPVEEDFPEIKGSTRGKEKQKNKSSSYLSLEEKQFLLRKYMREGSSFEDAKEQVEEFKNIMKEQRESMKEKGKSDNEIKTKQQEMLEELWNS